MKRALEGIAAGIDGHVRPNTVLPLVLSSGFEEPMM